MVYIEFGALFGFRHPLGVLEHIAMDTVYYHLFNWSHTSSNAATPVDFSVHTLDTWARVPSGETPEVGLLGHMNMHLKFQWFFP